MIFLRFLTCKFYNTFRFYKAKVKNTTPSLILLRLMTLNRKNESLQNCLAALTLMHLRDEGLQLLKIFENTDNGHVGS